MQSEQNHHPDYNFILNPAPPPKKSKLAGLGGGSKSQQLLIKIAGGFGILVLILVALSLIFGGGSNNTDRLVGITAQQTELFRIAEIGKQDATSADTRNFASTVSLSMLSAQEDTVTLLSKQGRKVGSQELSARKDSKTDDSLTTAKQSNRFDEAFNQIIKEQLLVYQNALQALFNDAGPDTRSTVQTLYQSAQVLSETD